MDQQGFDTKKIVAKAMSIKSLKDREKDLRNNCEILAERIDGYKQILPFAEKIVAMRINTAGLLALDDAVNNVAEMYNLPVYTAGLLGNQ
jgi:hypothetical protein